MHDFLIILACPGFSSASSLSSSVSPSPASWLRWDSTSQPGSLTQKSGLGNLAGTKFLENAVVHIIRAANYAYFGNWVLSPKKIIHAPQPKKNDKMDLFR